MKVVIIGGTGTIGEALKRALVERHDVVTVGRTHGDLNADMTDKASLKNLFAKLGAFDAIVTTAGGAAFKALADLDDADFAISLGDKLMGQVNVARMAMQHIADNGSITITGGSMAHEPMPGGTAISMVNAALEGFGRGAALELPRGIRLNVVSPPWVTETLVRYGMDMPGLPADAVAKAYVQSIEGSQSGAIIDPRQIGA
ncbi:MULTISPECIES: short chain dehydrogenase [Agrobacterium]|uniref:short chain dehydrogenase n=1 Tax=Agrobacterium tumefaciens TaxID=358 RepID=UPI000EF28EBF|nr:hypothetical protein At1D1108_50690 [Agrobacterium tumefaciens]NSY09813.1 short chain dehydrogenase [Agrobacterium tumefaciens]NSY93330.1 short chain dehydrogenase [Agrobacterium tumefaciens]